MNKEELLKILAECEKDADNDQEKIHEVADQALIEYIDDDDITKIYNEIGKWYA